MPVVKTKGAASAQGFGEFAKTGVANYIEDVFNTWLYTGTGASQTITNNIDLSTKGGLVWFKYRAGPNGPANHQLYDTARGVQKKLATNTTAAEATEVTGLTAFNTTGFTFGSDGNINASSSDTYVSWTFRKQAKFFDVVTYTGNGSTNRTISHNLQSTPGCVIIKRTDTTSDWIVWHTAMGNFGALDLNQTYSQGSWLSTGAGISSTTMQVGGGTGPAPGGSGFLDSNTNGGTYVAYLFAHNAGGFGLTGSDNVISCGSFTTDGSSNADVSLGYEPQWIMIKNSTDVSNWTMYDTMRGMSLTSSEYLRANLSNAAANYSSPYATFPTATGFTVPAGTIGAGTYIYIAIRRGPMKVPTVGTSVFSPNVSSATTGTAVTTNFPIDLQIQDYRTTPNSNFVDKLRGFSSNSTESGVYVRSVNTNAEASGSVSLNWNNTSFQITSAFSGADTVYYNFRRAPGYFDVVCYTGTGANTTITHNLGAVPELMIIKQRNSTFARAWTVYTAAVGNTKYLILNTTVAPVTEPTTWNNTTPTASVFSIGTDSYVNDSVTATYVAYLFATCSGVSKVGSYTGTAALLTVNCGFTAGARFVLIKRTDSTGDWYVYDSARGISSGTDPYLLLNSTAAEVTGTNYVDTDTTGFKVTAAAPAGLNASGGTYIFLAVA